MTPYLKCCARSQTLGQTCLPEMDRDHCCFSTVRFTYHMENEHPLQFQSYNSYAEQMWHSARGLAFLHQEACLWWFFWT